MYGLMNDISDIYNKRLLEYADKQEIFDIKMYVYFSLSIFTLTISCITILGLMVNIHLIILHLVYLVLKPIRYKMRMLL
jgi:uncharacterized membrane protein YjgN (DUF898 family)